MKGRVYAKFDGQAQNTLNKGKLGLCRRHLSEILGVMEMMLEDGELESSGEDEETGRLVVEVDLETLKVITEEVMRQRKKFGSAEEARSSLAQKLREAGVL